MSPDYRVLCVFMLLAMQQCQALHYSDEDGDYPEVSRRSSRGPSCQRCYNDPSDWVNCLSCYEGSSVPFYGQKKRTIYPERPEPSKRGFFDNDRDWAKRGFLDTDRDWAKRSPFPGYFDDRNWDKRSFFDSDRDWAKRSFFDTNRDWSKRSGDSGALAPTREEKRSRFMDCKCCMITAKESCCTGCNYVPYYGVHTFQKRVFAPRQQSYYGAYCSCCQTGNFDFGCCLSCALKK